MKYTGLEINTISARTTHHNETNEKRGGTYETKQNRYTHYTCYLSSIQFDATILCKNYFTFLKYLNVPIVGNSYRPVLTFFIVS